MKTGAHKKPAGKRQLALGVVCAVLLAALMVILLLRGCDGAVEMPGFSGAVPETTVEKNDGIISIPGYEMLELAADSREQTVGLSNPAQNTCYFEISLYLEDGTLLWKSGLIEPGEASKPLVLTKALSKGYYPRSVLRYACFSMDEDRSLLNGAETRVTLWVK